MHRASSTRSNARKGCAIAALAALLAACQATGGDNPLASAQDAAIGPRLCAVPLRSGPPPKPERLSAFGAATAWNVGRTVGRNAIAGAGTFVAGPVGGAVAGNLAARALPSEFDIRGNWTVTDGTPDCGCPMTITAPGSWTGTNTPRGDIRASGCNNAVLASANDWRLDESMAGLEAELLLYARNGNRIAVLKRDGPHYYSGQLSNGRPITLWRQ